MPDTSFENLLALLAQLDTIQKALENSASSSKVPEEFFTHIRRSIFAVAIAFQDRFLKIVSQDIMIHDIAAIVKDAVFSPDNASHDAVTRLHLLFLQRQTYAHVWNDPTGRYGAAPQEPVPSIPSVASLVLRLAFGTFPCLLYQTLLPGI
ncbi:hypothetical protein CC1G_13282 [Coprinopsis cinerea okayama7|uniref:Uncharacterized protein n=1 Tax=Coprinopsis cinerea (strain Okayama-7 / 130 / ATCC MYA-4618 / FGSC 9003) TaxID=240176 RepID=A8P604_COPC7|nr:hypothetical protein CC1G_13282 [Coprinopsis cinerea okayama7\|eukprot:XP_001839059.2 hypothetical protein CC1G_13282 [Coprinopsis cinerea okayama7\